MVQFQLILTANFDISGIKDYDFNDKYTNEPGTLRCKSKKNKFHRNKCSKLCVAKFINSSFKSLIYKKFKAYKLNFNIKNLLLNNECDH